MKYQHLLMIGLFLAAFPWFVNAADAPPAATKATFMVTGLHCPPCTKTVEGALAGIKGVNSIIVDWRTKSAKVEFDESILPAQLLALHFAATPHMMGGDMKYDGWLALKAPSVKDEANAKKVKETLKVVEGIHQVAVYPAQGAIGVQFSAKGKLTTKEVIDRLAKAGVEAATY